MRIIASFKAGTFSADVYSKDQAGDYRVKFYTANRWLRAADYFTDDKADAFATASHECQRQRLNALVRPETAEHERKTALGDAAVNVALRGRGFLALVVGELGVYAQNWRALVSCDVVHQQAEG